MGLLVHCHQQLDLEKLPCQRIQYNPILLNHC
jgi:hypothetical protein